MERHTPTNTGVKPHRIGAFDKLFKEENIDVEDRQYALNALGKELAQAGIVNMHQLNQTGDKPYISDACGEKFTAAGEFKIHMR